MEVELPANDAYKRGIKKSSCSERLAMQAPLYGNGTQLHHDEETGPLHGTYDPMDAELEVQRTIQRTELTAFLCLLTRLDPSRCMSTTKEL